MLLTFVSGCIDAAQIVFFKPVQRGKKQLNWTMKESLPMPISDSISALRGLVIHSRLKTERSSAAGSHGGEIIKGSGQAASQEAWEQWTILEQ